MSEIKALKILKGAWRKVPADEFVWPEHDVWRNPGSTHHLLRTTETPARVRQGQGPQTAAWRTETLDLNKERSGALRSSEGSPSMTGTLNTTLRVRRSVPALI